MTALVDVSTAETSNLREHALPSSSSLMTTPYSAD